MTTLLLVRHGQASALADDYDQLSPIGAEQGAKIGAHLGQSLAARWVGTGVASGNRPVRVLIGPRRRHAQTWAAMRGAIEHGWPDETIDDALDEHHGVQLVKFLAPSYATVDHPFGDAIRAVAAGGHDAHRAVGRMYRVALTGFCRGELTHPECEDWATFRARTRGFLSALSEAPGPKDETVIAITSGGAIAAMVAEALGATDDHVLELMWSIKNGSITRLRFGAPRFLGTSGDAGPRRPHLEAFNETGHLGHDDRLHTHV